MRIELNIPEGVSGDWSVENFTISQAEQPMLRFKYGARAPMAGDYTRLRHKGHVIMSNTRAEIFDHLPFIRAAKGNVLINGLGLGMCIKAILEKDSIESITVIEKSEDVIKLVAPTYLVDSRVKIINECAFSYKPAKGIRLNAVWHDIWPDICEDNLQEMAKLHRKYGRITDWQGSWAKSQCKPKRSRYAYY